MRLRRKFPAEGTICRHGKRDQHAPDASRAPLTVPTGAPTTFASVPHGSRREPPLPIDMFPDTPPLRHHTLRGKNSHTLYANRRRWNIKLSQVERQTVAGGHFCAPPATQNGNWCIPVPQVAKVFAHLQRSSVPPATLLPATGPSSFPLGKVPGIWGCSPAFGEGPVSTEGETSPRGTGKGSWLGGGE